MEERLDRKGEEVSPSDIFMFLEAGECIIAPGIVGL